MSTNNYYFDKGEERKKEVDTWYNDVINDYSPEIHKSIRNNIFRGKIDDAHKKFNDFMDTFEREEIDYNWAHFIEYNYSKFGKKRVREDLFYRNYLRGVGKRSIQRQLK